MFGIDYSEMMVIAVVAIIFIGPKDLPLALRTAGRWIARMRRMSAHFRSGIETMIREAELEEMEKQWREQNAAIMAASALPAADPQAMHEPAAVHAAEAPPPMLPLGHDPHGVEPAIPAASAEAAVAATPHGAGHGGQR